MLRKLARSTWQVMEVSLDTHTCTVMEGLTEDAVSARIHKGEAAAGIPDFCCFHGPARFCQLSLASLQAPGSMLTALMIRESLCCGSVTGSEMSAAFEHALCAIPVWLQQKMCTLQPG